MKNIVVTILLLASTAFAESKIKPGARIVFIGDSITGLSINSKDGFNHQMKWALSQSFDKESVPELISLGGSGQGVTSWMNVAKRSKEKETFLDIKGVDVKANLEKKADILIFMLGMNDILCPYVKPTEEDMDRWADDYIKLISNIRKRTEPEVTALASITLLTDAQGSPKDLIRKQLNNRVKDLTEKHGFIYIETGEEMEKLLKRGRALDSTFRPTYDFVHPNTLGHSAVAVAMLEGLDAVEPAKALRRKYFETGTFDCSKKAHLSYSYSIKPTGPQSEEVECTVNYTFTPKNGDKGQVFISQTMNYSDSPVLISATDISFASDEKFHTHQCKLKFTPSRHQTIINVETKTQDGPISFDISVPAPWLVASGIPNQKAWQGNDFKPEKASLVCEEKLINGEGFDAPLVVDGKSYPWQRYYASINYSGFDNPDSLAWYASTYCNKFEAAYAARWIYSEKDRKAELELGHDTFSSTIGLAIWINGDALEPVSLNRSSRKRQSQGITLKKGWNHLLLRSDHTTWQWQHICALKATEGDNLDDIRYSAVPK